MISYLDGSLGSRYFLHVVNERTCFALCISAFKGSRFLSMGKYPFLTCIVSLNKHSRCLLCKSSKFGASFMKKSDRKSSNFSC